MIKGLFVYFSFAIFLLAFPLTVSAHVLKYDGSIGAVLHVNPEDDPIAGETSNFFFEFKDKNNKFLPENCDCKVKVVKEGSEVYMQDLFRDNSNPTLTNISFSYVFPTIGVYSIIVDGKPKDSSFNEFILKYDVRVARTTTNEPLQTPSPSTNWLVVHKLHIILPVLIGVATLFIYFSTRKKK